MPKTHRKSQSFTLNNDLIDSNDVINEEYEKLQNQNKQRKSKILILNNELEKIDEEIKKKDKRDQKKKEKDLAFE